MNLYRSIIFAVSGILFLNGCKITKPYERPDTSVVRLDSLYRDVRSTDTTSAATLPWHQLFTDPKLQNLISSGLANNLDLKIALERIHEAQALLRQSKLAFLPSLNFAPNVTLNRTSRAALNLPPNININLKTTTYSVGVTTNWEVDVWGKMASAKRAVLANLLQTEAAQKALQTQLISNIASSYYALVSLDEQLAITLETIELRKKGVVTMQKLKESAVVTGAAVVQSESNLYAAEVSVPDLKQAIREIENALNVVLGRHPQPIDRNRLDDQLSTFRLHTGVPLQLLQNRPDVAAAEQSYRAAFENVNIAKTYFYPALAITAGSGGFSSLATNSIFANSLFYSLAAGLTQPIFAKGANKARLRTAEAQREMALQSFYKSLLVAGQEVSDALYAYEMGLEKEETRKKQIQSLEKAVNFIEQLLLYSSATNYTDVLTSEQALLGAKLAGVSDRQQQLQAMVSLYRALGGGWK
jgi:multidrug efflux system outer membrane protein